jgi:hypothetical protein
MARTAQPRFHKGRQRWYAAIGATDHDGHAKEVYAPESVRTELEAWQWLGQQERSAVDPTAPVDPLRVFSPGAVAERLGISPAALVSLMRNHHYEFVQLRDGGRPGDRGLGRWGMTAAQVRKLQRHQGYTFPGDPTDFCEASPDGIRRARRGPRCRALPPSLLSEPDR